MVSEKSIHKQLKRIGFKSHGWGRGEINELPHIILPDEEIYEMVNGLYEGGFALLLATDVRVLLIDKKPLNFLTVEDLRFEMINELDYSHRLVGAEISITSGSKNLRFRSYNQPRLRKLISHVQHCMAEAKKQQSSHQVDQKNHLEQINQQLQTYLLAQHQYQQQLAEVQRAQQAGEAVQIPAPTPVQPPKELADYLFAQSLLAQHNQTMQAEQPDRSKVTQEPLAAQPMMNAAPEQVQQDRKAAVATASSDQQLDEMYADGVKEVFGKHMASVQQSAVQVDASAQTQSDTQSPASNRPLEVNPLRLASSKLPMALRSRKFGNGPVSPEHQQVNDSGRSSSQSAKMRTAHVT